MINVLALTLTMAASAAPVSTGPAEQFPVQLYWQPGESSSWQKFFLLDLLGRRAGGKLRVEVVPIDDLGDAKQPRQQAPSDPDEARRVALIGKTFASKLGLYLAGRATNPSPAGWVEAARFAGLSPRELDKRMRAGEGETALAELRARASASRTPAIFAGGKRVDKDGSLLELASALNAARPGLIPMGPDAPEIIARLVPRIMVVTDPALAVTKEDPNLSQGLARMFPSAVQKVVAWGSPEAAEVRSLVDFLPAYVIEDNEGARGALKAAIDGGFLARKGKWLVVSSKGRNGAFLTRPEEPDHLDVFVMSHCPFGIQAENALADARKKGVLPAGLKVRLHHIVELAPAKLGAAPEFKSLHGPSEWQEDVRQLVVQERWPDKLWAYLALRNKNPQGDWQPAAKEAGIPPAELEGAFEQGKTLLAKDARLCADLGVGSSPTFMYRGRYLSVGLNGLGSFPGFDKVEVKSAAGGGGSCSN